MLEPVYVGLLSMALEEPSANRHLYVIEAFSRCRSWGPRHVDAFLTELQL